MLSVIVDYILFLRIAPKSNMEFQVKVEQVKDKWITFIVSSEYPRFRKYSFEDISRSQELFE